MHLRTRGWIRVAVGLTVCTGMLLSPTGAPAASYNLAKKYVKPAPAAGDALGFSTATVGANVVVGVPYDDTAGTNTGIAYLFDGTTGKMIRSFMNPDAVDADEFGWSVASDGTKVAIGALLDDSGGGASTNAGAVYVFDAGTGALLLDIPDPSPAANDYFGYSVAIAGSYILVGAPLHYSDDRGTAYLFDSTSGTLLGALVPPTSAANDEFGFAVATDGTNCLVGAPYVAQGANADAGQAYVFDCASRTLVSTLTLPSPGLDDALGSAVAISGNDCLIGSPNTDTGLLSGTGSAHRFDCTTGALLTSYYKTNPGPSSSDGLGTSVAFLGSSDVLVGAIRDDSGGFSDNGAVYRFSKSAGTQLQRYVNASAQDIDNLGQSVASVGSNFVAGVPFSNIGATDAGVANLFDASSGAILQTLRKPDASFSFGIAVAGQGNTLVATAGTIGEVYVLDSNGGGSAATGQILRIVRNPEPFNTNWGLSLAFLGDDLILGHPFVGSPYGRVYLVDVSTGAFLLTITNPTPGSNDFFGQSVSGSGNSILIGAPGDNGHVGAAYLYDATTGALLRTFLGPNSPALDQFGMSVAISGNNCLMGSPYTTIGPDTNAGRGYLFNCTTGALLCTFQDADPHDDDQLGIAVAFTSDGKPAVGANVSQKVLIFDPATCNLLRTILNPSGGNDAFGNALAGLAGGDLVVGAPTDQTNSKGSAWIFDSVGSGNIHLQSDAPVNNALFGGAVAGVGNDVFIGARTDGPSASFVGKAYYFVSTPVCGDGFVDAGEACDGQACCTASCQWATPGTVCTDDGNLCTDDVCDGTGPSLCTHPPKTAGTACTPDSNTCTKDECDGNGLCTHPNQMDGFACSDGTVCTTNDVCSGGQCVGGAPLNCDDGNQCTNDSCNATNGCQYSNKSNGTACDDGIPCSTASACASGQCKPTACQSGSCSLPNCGGSGTCGIINGDVKTCDCR